MNAEFNWWLLIVGLVIGAGLVWLILADSSRREADVAARERASEARWIAEELRRTGRRLDDEDVAEVLDLHTLYLSAPPPDVPEEDAEPHLAGAARGWPATDRDLSTRDAMDPTATEDRSADVTPAERMAADGTTRDPVVTDPSAVDWAARRTASERPRSDGRDQPSPSRTG